MSFEALAEAGRLDHLLDGEPVLRRLHVELRGIDPL
jgi:hypothetical protein